MHSQTSRLRRKYPQSDSRHASALFGDHDGKLEVILGLDFGSSATRANLYEPSRNQHHHVVCPESGRSRFSPPCDFPAIANVWADNNGYIGTDTGKSVDQMSLKYLMYLIVQVKYALRDDKDDVVLRKLCEQASELAVLDTLQVHLSKNTTDVLAILDDLIIRHMAHVAKAVSESCELHGFWFKDIVVTMPATWTKPFQDEYTDILERAWPIQACEGQFTFIHESEAAAHWMLSSLKRNFAKPKYDLKDDVTAVMLIDFGGHSINGSTFYLTWSKDGRKNVLPSFIACEKSWGVPGGLEYFSHVIHQAIKGSLENMGQRKSQRLVYELMEVFRAKQGTLGYEQFKLTCDQGDWVPSNNDATAWFGKAFEAPLDEIERRINSTWNRTMVVLSGGSFRNETVRLKVEQLIRSRELPFLVLHQDPPWHQIDHPSMIVSRGACLARARMDTVIGFLEQGAAFGIQIGGNDADVMLSANTAQTVTVHLNKLRTSVKVICSPFSKGEGKIRWKTCYDFKDLGERAPGTWNFTLRHIRPDKDSKNKDIFELEESRTFCGVRSYGKMRWPVYFEAGQRVVMIDQDQLAKENGKPYQVPGVSSVSTQIQTTEGERGRSASGKGKDKNHTGILKQEHEGEMQPEFDRLVVIVESSGDEAGDENALIGGRERAKQSKTTEARGLWQARQVEI